MIKKISLIIMLGIFLLNGCKSTDVNLVKEEMPKKMMGTTNENISIEEKTDIKTITGYILIKDNKLYVDEVELINCNDTERLKQLNLTQEDCFLFGNYPLAKRTGILAFEITDKTKFNYSRYIDKNKEYETVEDNDEEEFINHLGNQNEKSITQQTVPYVIEIKNNEVVLITEEFEFTV